MKRVLIILFILSSCASFAQEETDIAKKDTFEYNVFKEDVYFWQLEKNYKFSPFDVLNAVPTFGLDMETVMKPGLSFQYGLAYIPSFMQFIVGSEQNKFNWMRGYRVRFESRFSGFLKESFYLSTELSMRHLIISDDVSFGMDPDEFGNYAYFMEEPVRYHRFSTHVNLKIGFQHVVSDKIVLDLYSGLSFRRNNVNRIDEIPDNGGIQQSFLNLYEWRIKDDYRFGYVLPIIGVRLGIHKPATPNL